MDNVGTQASRGFGPVAGQLMAAPKITCSRLLAGTGLVVVHKWFLVAV